MPNGVTELARDDRSWVAGSAAQSGIVSINRRGARG
jgi:hypothetical protein